MMGARRGLTDKARRHFSKGLDDLALAIAMTQHSRISLTLAAPSWSGVPASRRAHRVFDLVS